VDLSLLTYPKDLVPEGVDPSLWVRYIRGVRAWDDLYGKGERCPGNPEGIRCGCLIPTEQICLIYVRVAEIAAKIGGWMGEHVGGLS